MSVLKPNPGSRRVPSQAEEKLLGKFLFKCCILVSLDRVFNKLFADDLPLRVYAGHCK